MIPRGTPLYTKYVTAVVVVPLCALIHGAASLLEAPHPGRCTTTQQSSVNLVVPRALCWTILTLNFRTKMKGVQAEYIVDDGALLLLL